MLLVVAMLTVARATSLADAAILDATEEVLGGIGVRQTLEDDLPLFEAYRRSLFRVFQEPHWFSHVTSSTDTAAYRLRDALEENELPESLVRVFAFTAAYPGLADRDWALVENSDGDLACARGPLSLTYAQGYHLGLTNLQLDGYTEPTDSGERAAIIEGMRATALRIEAPTSVDWDLIRSVYRVDGHNLLCHHIDGDDDRTDVRAIARELTHRLGTRAWGQQRLSDRHGVVARVAALQAFDFRSGRSYVPVSFEKPPGAAVSGLPKEQADFVIDRTAAVLSVAVAIPCLASLGDGSAPGPGGNLPARETCATLRAQALDFAP